MASEAIREVDIPKKAAGLTYLVGRTEDELIPHLEVVTSAEPAHVIHKLLNQVTAAGITRTNHGYGRNADARESDFENTADIREVRSKAAQPEPFHQLLATDLRNIGKIIE